MRALLLSTVIVLAALAAGCSLCALWTYDGCPGTGAYDACNHKNAPGYCCESSKLGGATPSPYCANAKGPKDCPSGQRLTCGWGDPARTGTIDCSCEAWAIQ